MLPFKYMAVLAYLALVYGQDDYDYEPAPRPAPARIQPGYSGPSAAKPTPVPILKQINRHHEDGSYTYGYEGADGSFKIETKLPTGEVKGKYGYVDDTGKVRVVEYGATKYGFEPAGEGITVAPPTLVDETTNRDGSINPQYTGAYYNDEPQSQPQPQPQQHHIRVAPARPRPQLQQSFEYSGPQQFTSASQRNSAPLPQRAHISGASPSLVSHHDFEFGSNLQQPERSFAPQRNYAPQRSFAPTPPRASPTFTFAQPAQTDEDDSSYEQAPAPIRSSPRITYAEPNHLSEPRAFAPAPRPASPQYASSRPSPSISGRSGGILDQLSKDYALPQGGAAPLHDISFGYY